MDPKMNIQTFKAEYPAIAEALIAEGKASVDADKLRAEGHETGKAEGHANGASAERNRIQAIFALQTPGHEALIKDAMFDGQSTAGDVATKIVAADNAARGNKLDALRKDGAAVGQVQPGAANLLRSDIVAEDKNLPVEGRCKAKWDKDPAVRAEFTSLETYTAFVKAEESGRVRLVGRKSA